MKHRRSAVEIPSPQPESGREPPGGSATRPGFLSVIVGAAPAKLDAGSIALWLAHELGARGRPCIVIDADSSASGDDALANRLGAAVNRHYEPPVRGLPALIAAHRPLTEQLISEHAYSLDGVNGPAWVMFGPENLDGRRHVNRWISAHMPEMRRLASQRGIVVSASMNDAAQELSQVCADADAVVLLSAGIDEGELAAANEICFARTGGRPRRRNSRCVVVPDDAPLDDARITERTAGGIVGRLPATDDARVLRDINRRRGRKISGPLGEIAQWLIDADGRADCHDAADTDLGEAAAATAADQTGGEHRRS